MMERDDFEIWLRSADKAERLRALEASASSAQIIEDERYEACCAFGRALLAWMHVGRNVHELPRSWKRLQTADEMLRSANRKIEMVRASLA